MDADPPARHDQLSRTLHTSSATRQGFSALRSLLASCLEEAERELAGGQVFVSWDWDMIRNYMFYDSPTERYGDVLVETLNLGGSGARVIILDGARREMQAFLLARARYYRGKRLRMDKDEEWTELEEPHRPKGLLRIPDVWARERKSINELADLQSIKRLAIFLDSTAVSVEQAFPRNKRLRASIATASPFYRNAQGLLTDRPGEQRNRADALNIAQVDSARAEGIYGVLVTGTHHILDAFPKIAVHPLSYLFSFAVQAQIPDPQVRVATLNRWLGTVTEMIGAFSTFTASLEGAEEPLEPKRLRTLGASLGLFKNETILRSVGEILSKAALVTRSREQHKLGFGGESQLRASAEEGVDLRMIEAEFTRVLDKVLTSSGLGLSGVGVTWRADKIEAGYERWKLSSVDSADLEVLTMEISAPLYSVHWPVGVTLEQSVCYIERVLGAEAGVSDVLIECLGNDLIIKTRKIDPRKVSLAREVHKVVRQVKMKRLRLLIGETAIFFEDAKLNERPRLAVVDEDRSFSWVLILAKETLLEVVPENNLRLELGRRLEQALLQAREARQLESA